VKQERTWIVVADGGQARILVSTGRMKGVRRLPGGQFQTQLPASREIMSERQPRVHESVGQARHAVEPRHDPHEDLKQQFLVRLAQYLEGAERRGEFEHLLVVAPATAMGDLRQEFGPALRGRLLREIVHDYTHQSDDFVYRQIKDKLPR
jgi:protein required for attachment to host cells